MENYDNQDRKDFQLNAYTELDSDPYYNQIKAELNVLKMQAQSLQLQNQTLNVEKEKLEKVLNNYKNSPAIVGTISEIFLDKLKAVIRTNNGMVFYVNVPEDIIKTINVEDRVVMAQNNLAILDVLAPEKDYRAIAFEINEKPKQSLKDIGGLKKVINEDSVRTSINNILGTFQGERIMLPEFASNLRSLVFERTTRDLTDKFAIDVKNMIERWDDRVIVSTVSFNIDPDNHFVSITVLFMIKSYTEIFQHTVTLV